MGEEGLKDTTLRVTYFLNDHLNKLEITTGERKSWISDFHTQTSEISFDYLTKKIKIL